ncbi:7802_t:CDS:2 [Funneliformis geosporum]|nr:7802_t:CDS:2 [Funneliformis geosporum]
MSNISYDIVHIMIHDQENSYCDLCSTVTVLDLFAGNMVIRSLIYKIGFIPGQLAIQIYLASIFRLIPKLSLSQSISSSFLPNKSEISNSKITTIWIPKGFDIDRNGDNKRARILLFCVDLIYECNNLFYVICFLFYGRISVNLAIKGIELAGINDINENSNQASQECQIIFKARIRRGLKNGNNGKKSIY